MTLRSINDLTTEEAYRLVSEHIGHAWPPLDAVESEDWGRENVPEGSVYFDETLECGHTFRQMTGLYEVPSCPECPSQPPYLDREVVIIEDEIVPYSPGDLRKKGWCFVSDPVAKVPCVHKTSYLLVNPAERVERRRRTSVEKNAVVGHEEAHQAAHQEPGRRTMWDEQDVNGSWRDGGFYGSSLARRRTSDSFASHQSLVQTMFPERNCEPLTKN
jgi:hypothetical protein